MNYAEAFKILELDESNDIDLSLKCLKDKYRKMALKYHPDKNGNTLESNEHFKKINEAYQYLKAEFELEYESDETDDHDNSFNYFDVLKNFVKAVMDKNYNETIVKIISDIINSGKEISLKIFDNIDKDVVLCIYSFLSKYKQTLHFSDSLLESIRQIMIQKYENVEIYKLNPNINDLLENNFYKLYVSGQLYLVPLWYYESYYETEKGEIIVVCDPELPENTNVDENNNITIDYFIDAYDDLPNMLKSNEDIIISLGNQKFFIQLASLNIKSLQYYRFRNKGISKIKKNIYDIAEKGDIIVRIHISV